MDSTYANTHNESIIQFKYISKGKKEIIVPATFTIIDVPSDRHLRQCLKLGSDLSYDIIERVS